MKLRWTACIVLAALVIAWPGLAHAQGRSYRTTGTVRPQPMTSRQSTVDVRQPADAPRVAYGYRYGLATGAAQQALSKRNVPYQSTLLQRTTGTIFGQHSRYGLVNGAGSLLAGDTTDPYQYRQRSELGRNVAGTAVMVRDLVRNVGQVLQRRY